MLLMLEMDIRDGICHAIYWYSKANNKYMKDYDKDKELSYLRYWDVNMVIWLGNATRDTCKGLSVR